MTWLERGVRNTENDLAWASLHNWKSVHPAVGLLLMTENVAQHKIAFTKNEAMHKTTESVFFVRAKDQWLAKVFEGCKNYEESRNLSNEPQDACRY